MEVTLLQIGLWDEKRFGAVLYIERQIMLNDNYCQLCGDGFDAPQKCRVRGYMQAGPALIPARVALRFFAQTLDQAVVLSYRELDQRARTIASALQAEAAWVIARCCCFPAARITSRRS
jgi:hypothetical protein